MKRLALLLLVLAHAAAAQAPRDFAYGIALSTEGDSAFYQVELPAAVYAGTVRDDLGDVRVFNADGALVPFAYVPRSAAVREKIVPFDLPLFPLRVEQPETDLSGLALTLNRSAGGATTLRLTTRDGAPVAGDRLIGYVLDTSALSEPLVALVANWTMLPRGVGMRFRVEASDDLANWRMVVSDAPLIDLEYEGRHLRRDRIEMPATKAKYLRLSWATSQPPLNLAAVSGEYAARNVDPPVQWTEVGGMAVPEHEGDYDFDLKGTFPIDRIAIALPERNTVVPAQLSARASPQDPWRVIASNVLYRLRQGDTEVNSPPITVNGVALRYWRLHVDPNAGGLGAGLPRLRAGWLPQQIVFAARGGSPFVLAYGSSTALSNALPIQTMVPGYNTPAAPAIGVATPQSTSVEALGGAERLTRPIDAKRWLLWSTLVLGVLVLGWMAWRLSHQMSAPAAGEVHAPKGDDT
jgi:Protein of unknown function (DUF3999)